MSFLKPIKEWLDHLRGKGPAAAVALTLDLGEARDNKPFMLEAGAVFVERCDGDLYARVNGPNGDGINLRYVKKILYPVSSLFLTNSAQAGKSARLLLLPIGMDADPPAAAAAAAAVEIGLGYIKINQIANTDRFYALNSNVSESARANAEAAMPPGTVKRIRVHVLSVDIDVGSTLQLMRNGSAVLTVSFSAAGYYESAGDVSIADGDLLCWNLSTVGATAGAVVIPSVHFSA